MNHEAPQRADARPLFWTTRRGARIALVILHACALGVAILEWIRPFDDHAHGIDRVPALDFMASYALYGFVACVILVLLGRLLRRLVMRDESYYDRGET